MQKRPNLCHCDITNQGFPCLEKFRPFSTNAKVMSQKLEESKVAGEHPGLHTQQYNCYILKDFKPLEDFQNSGG